MSSAFVKILLACSAIVAPSASYAQAAGSNFTIASRYDTLRRLVGRISPKPNSTNDLRYLAERTTYDGSGNVVRVEKGELESWQPESVVPSNWQGFTVFSRVETTYDLLGRKTVDRTYNGGSSTPIAVTQFSYNALGLVECTATRMNLAPNTILPAAACDQGVMGDQGPDRIERNEYDSAGQLSRIIRGYGTPIQQIYATYTYDANGKQVSVTDANGNLAQLAYDGFGRQSLWVFPSKSNLGQTAGGDGDYCNKAEKNVGGGDYEAYCYDANGNRTRLRRRDGRVIDFVYDNVNRVVSKLIADGCVPNQVGICAPNDTTRDVFYSYDIRGLQTSARFDSDSGEGVITTYNGFGEITSTVNNMGGQSRSVGYKYDPDGNQTQITFPDGVSFTQTYDDLDRLRGISQADGLQIVGVTWNPQGNVELLDKAGASTRYEYDGIKRLTSQSHSMAINSVSISFGYNAASQIVERKSSNDSFSFKNRYTVDRQYDVNGLNQYIKSGSVSLSYDANGNLISDGSVNYLFDGENRLVASSAGVTLRYDPLGRLWQSEGPSGVTRFLYDGDQLIGEYDAGGNMLRRYIHGPNDDDPLMWYEGAGLGDRRLLMADHQGSIVAITESSGNPLRINAYDEYGIPNAENLGRFQYTGQILLSDLGLYYYKARIYSPTLGRFLQTDPIGYDDQVNLYAYVSNDPVNNTDPTGQETGTFSNGCQGNGTGCDPDGKVHEAAMKVMLTTASLLAAPELFGIKAFSQAVAIRVGGVLIKAGDAAGTRLAEREIVKAAQGTLSGLAKGEGRVYAGPGAKSGRALDVAEHLARKYGGKAGDYQGVTSKVIAEGSNGAKVEVHAFRNIETKKIYNPKIKVQGGQ